MKGTFTYVDFYSRRIKRIFPSLIIVLTFTLAFGCSIYIQDKQIEEMAKTSFAATLFSANIQILTRQGGYWDLDVKKV